MSAAASRRRKGSSSVIQVGQGVVEYGIILAGIAAVTIVALVFFGDPIAHVLDFISRLVEGAN